MRLLLDEMYPPVIAEQLRSSGHDVVAVTEALDLVGLSDLEIWRLATPQRRAIVTENAVDFLTISKRAVAEGEAAPTLLITSNRSLPRHAASFIGAAVRTLAAFCHDHPQEDPQNGAVHWLRPAG